MKIILSSILFFAFAAAAATAFGQQQPPDFSGAWVYNKVVSLPGEPLRTATFKMVVAQTPAEINVGIVQTAPGGQIAGSQTPTEQISFYFGRQDKTGAQKTAANSAPGARVEKFEKGVLSLVTEENVKTANGRDAKLKIREMFEKMPGGDALKIHRQVFVDETFPILEIFIADRLPGGAVAGYRVEDAANLKNLFPKDTLNGKVRHFREPDYPNYVKNSRVVNDAPIRVIFDETGRVVFAQSYMGSNLMKMEAAEAAMQCVFEPVAVGGAPVRISGTIAYTVGGPLPAWK